MRRLAGALLFAVLLLGALAPASFASEDWCSVDPIMVLTTPGGTSIPVYVLTTARILYQGDLATASYGYTATPYVRDEAGDLGTVFTVNVTIPNDPVAGTFDVQSAINSEPGVGVNAAGMFDAAIGGGVTYATSNGTSGTTVSMTFLYPVA